MVGMRTRRWASGAGRQALEPGDARLAQALGVGHDVRLADGHEIGRIEELADGDLVARGPTGATGPCSPASMARSSSRQAHADLPIGSSLAAHLVAAAASLSTA